MFDEKMISYFLNCLGFYMMKNSISAVMISSSRHHLQFCFFGSRISIPFSYHFHTSFHTSLSRLCGIGDGSQEIYNLKININIDEYNINTCIDINISISMRIDIHINREINTSIKININININIFILILIFLPFFLPFA